MENLKKLESYDYSLPPHLIANYPIYPKCNARLLVYYRNSGDIIHTTFAEFFNLIPKDTLIVLNDTKVLKARIIGNKQSESKQGGGKVELLYHNAWSENKFVVQIRGRVKIGDILLFANGVSAKVIHLGDNGRRIVEFYHYDECLGGDKILTQDELFALLEIIGRVPLPPYIKRNAITSDELDYQSVFAKNIGAIAAPTASLHFDDNDLVKIMALPHCFITLHIGAGTFFGVESPNITQHKMHKERFFIPKISQEKLDSATKILAIGTTACRCVEEYHRNRRLSGECELFLNPLNPPQRVDYLLTNFHLPKSSLIMLVAGFVGLEEMQRIYAIAKEMQYRFYSYGDGMLIL